MAEAGTQPKRSFRPAWRKDGGSFGAPTTPKQEEPEEQFEVESIRAQRTTEEGAVEYLIRWKGHTWEDDTWEPKENVLDPALVADFEAREKAREEKLAKKGAKRGKPAAGADAKAAKRKARGLVKF